jgi:hypothetical protein
LNFHIQIVLQLANDFIPDKYLHWKGQKTSDVRGWQFEYEPENQ